MTTLWKRILAPLLCLIAVAGTRPAAVCAACPENERFAEDASASCCTPPADDFFDSTASGLCAFPQSACSTCAELKLNRHVSKIIPSRPALSAAQHELLPTLLTPIDVTADPTVTLTRRSATCLRAVAAHAPVESVVLLI